MPELTKPRFVHVFLMVDALLMTAPFLGACVCEDPLMSNNK